MLVQEIKQGKFFGVAVIYGLAINLRVYFK